MQFFFNKPLRILLLSNSLILIAGAMFGPITALFVEKVGGDLLDASLAGTVFALVAGVVVLVSGHYTDKVKNRYSIVVVGYLLMAVGFLLFTVVNSVWSLLLVQVVIGLGEAIYAPAFDAVYSHHLDNGHVGKQWSLWEALYYFTTAGGALLGGLIATYFGFNAIFIIMSLLAFGSAIYLAVVAKKLS